MIQQDDYKALVSELNQHQAQLIAVSKFQAEEKIQALYNWGHRDFGENYVQEMVAKHAILPQDIRWHFIGHLQTNKVKYIAPFVHMIQSVDSFKLLSEINKQAIKLNRVIDVLLQIYVGEESTKFGLDARDVLELLSIYEQQKPLFQGIRIRGFMGMATLTNNTAIIHQDFKEMEALYCNMKTQFFLSHPEFDTLCMGMSDDYKIALEYNSNMVRIGSTIFGRRNIQ